MDKELKFLTNAQKFMGKRITSWLMFTRWLRTNGTLMIINPKETKPLETTSPMIH